MYTPMQLDVVDQLLALRAAGLSQAQIARATGIRQPTISRILSRQHKDVLASTARRIDQLHQQVCILGQDAA
jgi:transcriptional regulator with XRE-family HTH domain